MERAGIGRNTCQNAWMGFEQCKFNPFFDIFIPFSIINRKLVGRTHLTPQSQNQGHEKN